MTVQQLAAVKRWHQTHRRGAPLERQFWDAVLTCWILGLAGLPAAVVLAPIFGVAACALLFCAPEAYVALRRRLHRRRILRCDWLASASK